MNEVAGDNRGEEEVMYALYSIRDGNKFDIYLAS
jgi:hypothetical protein